MSDPELEKIRQQRLAQLQAQHGVSCLLLRLCGYNFNSGLLFISVDFIVIMLLREYPKEFIIWCRSFTIKQYQ